jgi:hypothetical protein
VGLALVERQKLGGAARREVVHQSRKLYVQVGCEPIGGLQGTFREHSANMKGNNKTAAVDIHGIFRKHARNIQFELRWTPVSPY